MNIRKNILTPLRENNETKIFVLFFICFIFKYLISGFCYFPVLDDYIQYGGYSLYENPSFVLFEIGTIASRPLASILDIFLWGNLWNTPHVMLIVSASFHFFSCVFFYKTAKENNIALSPLFAVFYLFFPLGYEGSYWISASSRIVVGLFFCSVAFFCLSKHLKNGKPIFFIIFFLASLCSFALYESCAVFCFVMSVIIVLISTNKKRSVLPLVSLYVLLCALLVYMKLAQNIGMMGTRASESSFMLIFSQIDDFFSQLAEITANGMGILTFKGFSDGISLLFAKGILGILYLIAILFLCTLIGRFTAGLKIDNPCKKRTVIQICAGIVLFFAPFAPNMIADPLWITYRTMFIPLIGLYLIADAMFMKIKQKSIQTILLTSLMFIFIISGINEYDTYKRTYELDSAMIKVVCHELPDDVLDGSKNAAVLLDDVPCVSQTSYYKDHVKSVFYTDWSLTGAVREEMKNMNIKKVTPVYPDMTFDYSDCFVIDLRSNN